MPTKSWFLIVGFFLAVLLNGSKAAIIIDGDASDWSTIPVTAKNNAGTVTLKSTFDSTYLYFSVVGSRDAHYSFLLDTDHNAATGGSSPDGLSAGFDYLVEDGALYKYAGPGWNWTPLSRGLLSKARGSVIEVRLDRATFPGLADTVGVKYFRFNRSWSVSTQIPSGAAVATVETSLIPQIALVADENNLSITITGAELGPQYHLFLNTDNDSASGYIDGGWTESGCDYLVENGTLWRYVGPGWNWTLVADAVVTSNLTENRIDVQLRRTDLAPLASRIALGFCDLSATWTVEQRSPATGPLRPIVIGPEVAAKMKIMVPAYFLDNALWNRLANAAQAGPPGTLYAIANLNNGPLTDFPPEQAALQQVIAQLHAAGGKTVGYVDTNYTRVDPSKVKADIDKWYADFGVDGIFLDQQDNTAASLPYYQEIHDYIKAKGGEALVVANPGTSTLESYMQVNDVTCIIEADGPADFATWTTAFWTRRYPADKFYVLPYHTPASDYPTFVNRAAANHVGWIYCTSDTLPNPWDTLPDYFEGLVNAVSQVGR